MDDFFLGLALVCLALSFTGSFKIIFTEDSVGVTRQETHTGLFKTNCHNMNKTPSF